MTRRNLAKERRVYERMWENQPQAQREYTAQHFAAVATQHPDGCDAGRKVPALKDHDCMYDQYGDDFE